MTELYPVIEDEKLLGVIGSGGEVTKLCLSKGMSSHECRYYLWISRDLAVDITPMITGSGVYVDGVRIPIISWTKSMPYIHARTFADFESYVEELAKILKSSIESRNVVLGFSGGKDSTALLIILLELQKYVSFKLHVVYVKLPFIDSPENIKFIDKVSKTLNIDIEILVPKRRDFRSMLQWRGLPKWGDRWCTYYKVKPMRDYMKKLDNPIEAIGDRVLESPKRLSKWVRILEQMKLATERRLMPILTLTLPDIVLILRSRNLVNPLYLKGLPRISCTYCPFKTLYEFSLNEEVEDPGFIDEIIRRDYRKRYHEIPFDEFEEHELWRFSPELSKALLKLKHEVLKREEYQVLRLNSVSRIYTSIWSSQTLSNLPVVSTQQVLKILKQDKPTIPLINPEQNGQN